MSHLQRQMTLGIGLESSPSSKRWPGSVILDSENGQRRRSQSANDGSQRYICGQDALSRVCMARCVQAAAELMLGGHTLHTHISDPAAATRA
jgi:hypothetical protein